MILNIIIMIFVNVLNCSLNAAVNGKDIRTIAKRTSTTIMVARRQNKEHCQSGNVFTRMTAGICPVVSCHGRVVFKGGLQFNRNVDEKIFGQCKKCQAKCDCSCTLFAL